MTLWQGIGFALVSVLIILELAQIMGTLGEIEKHLDYLTKHRRSNDRSP